LYCVSGGSGREEWRFGTGGGVYSSPAIGDVDGDGRAEIAVASWDGWLYLLKVKGERGQEAGEILWARWHGDGFGTGLLENALSYGLASKTGTTDEWTPGEFVPPTKQPPFLELSLSFRDVSGDDILEGLETGRLTVSVSNTGEGPSYGLSLSVSLKPASIAKMIEVQTPESIKRIKPGETKRVSLRLKADVNLPTGEAVVVVSGKERSEYDPMPVFIKIKTRRFKKPLLQLSEIEIVDDGSGFSSGNGDGVIQNGETVEVHGSLRNIGEGEGKGVRVSVESSASGVEIRHQPDFSGDIPSGGEARVRFAVAVSRTFGESYIPISVRYLDARGFGSSQEITLNCELVKPVLSITTSVFDGGSGLSRGNGNGILERGERVELRVRVRNEGELEARGVKLSLSGLERGIRRVKGEAELGRIPPGREVAGSLSVHLGRSGRFKLTVKAEQEDFEGSSAEVELDVKERIPPEIPGEIPASEEVSPPLVIITEPKGERTDRGSVKLSAVITDEKREIKEVKVYLNGVEVKGRGVSVVPSGREVRIERELYLKEGWNRIEVVATNGVKEGRGIKVIRYEAVFDPTGVYRRKHALVVGVDRYEHLPPKLQLGYAVSDAEAMAKLLKEYGFEVKLLINATKGEIERELARLADKRVVSENDAVLFFFAGHGQSVRLPEGEMGFLIPSDADVNLSDPSDAGGYMASAIPMSRLKEYAKAIQAKHRLFILDCCFSGLATDRGMRKLSKATRRQLKLWARFRAAQVITAGGKGQSVPERGDVGHGAFTYELLKGLKGLADLDDNGIITASELGVYLKRKMADYGLMPQLGTYFGTEGDFMFVK
ncbi:caspase family protein, partial [Candidatus Poribacteria bacterium]|nr:caspase family protein [Candidatus Poribacteria bacterium]